MQTEITVSTPKPKPAIAEAARDRINNRTLLLFATALTLALWFMPYGDVILYPIRLFVTFVHESGHALSAIATGGSVASLTIRPDGSGVTMTADPPWALGIVFSGGYLGATLFGAMLLQVGRLHRLAGRAALYAASIAVLVITVLWAHNPITNGFTLLSGMLMAVALAALARFTSPRAAEFIAAFLAVQCCLNALTDLRTLLYITSHNLGDNDAVFMSQHFPLPPLFWAFVWAVMALGILGVSLRSYWKATGRR